jgi:hypothetical protein
MMRFVLPIALVLAGCAPVPDAPSGGQALARAVGPASGPAQECISIPPGEALTVLIGQTLGYGSGRTVWVNHVPAQCRLSSSFSTVIVERQSSRVCRGDRVRTIETGASLPGPLCVLGPFVPHAAL